MSDDYGQTPGTAGTLEPDPLFPQVSFRTAVIETDGDEDWFAVTLVVGESYNFYVTGAPSGFGTITDPLLRLYDPSGVLLDTNDNYSSTESYLRFVAPSSGTYYISAAAVGPETGNYTIIAASLGVLGPNDFYGTRFDDSLTGTSSDDTMIGFNGMDTIVADAGADLLYGGDADDSLDGGDGADTIYGDAGSDTIDGGDGNDVIHAGAGASDTVQGGAGVDRVVLSSAGFSFNFFTDPGVDFGLTPTFGSPDVTHLQGVEIFELSTGTQFELLLTPNGAGQSVAASRGLRTLAVGGDGADTIVGSDVAGRDYLYGGFGQDTLTGGAGADWFDSFFNALSSIDGDVITDFQNDDSLIIRVDLGPQHVTYVQQAGQLQIRIDSNLDLTTDATITLLGDFGALIPEFSVNNYAPGFTVISFATQLLFGDAGGNLIAGDGGKDSILGAAGNDTINGGAGADTLKGEDGADILTGGAGADSIDGGAGTDLVNYGDATGYLTVRLWNGTGSGNIAHGDILTSIENVAGGNFNDNIIGSNSVANWLGGGLGSDYLDGLSGNDTLLGGGGNDSLYGGAGADRLDGGVGADMANYAQATGGVTVRLWNGTGTNNIAAGDTLIGIENLAGSSFSDILFGADVVANWIGGGLGNDYLSGLSGNDTLVGGAGADTMAGGAGNDRFEFSSGSGADRIDDFTAGAGVADVIRITGYGAALNSFAEILAVTTQVGADAVINLGGGNTITLVGTLKTSLVADDFTFV